jgi:hypothetical protein
MFKKLFFLILVAGILYVAYYFIMTVVAPAIDNKREGGEKTIPDESRLSREYLDDQRSQYLPLPGTLLG